MSPWVCEQIGGHKGGGHKEIWLELSWALAGLKIPKICLSDMWFLVYRRAAAGDKRGGRGVGFHNDVLEDSTLALERVRRIGCVHHQADPYVRLISGCGIVEDEL